MKFGSRPGSWLLGGLLVLVLSLLWRSARDSAVSDPPTDATPVVISEMTTVAKLPEVVDGPRNSDRPPTTRVEVREVLEILLQRRKNGSPLPSKQSLSRFGYEKSQHLTEGRLLALLYPKECERLAGEIVFDSLRPLGDRQFAIRLLGHLAAAGERNSEALLIRLLSDPDPGIRELSVHSLWPSDRTCAYRNIYCDQCREANRAAFKALSFQPDSANLNAARELLEGEGGDIRGERRLLAQNTLDKYEMLLSANASTRLRDILVHGVSPDMDEWALTAAGRSDLPGFQEGLRQRLDRDMQAARNQDAFWRADDLKEGVRRTESFETTFVTHLDPRFMCDRLYDSFLLAYRQTGGSLSELEMKRLKEFGYEGDAKENLSRLLGDSSENLIKGK